MPNAAGSGSMLKLAMLGDGGVGKTALVIQLCLNKFVETYDPTIEDSYRKRVLLDEHAITLELMDTAGQEEYLALQDQWIRDGEGFLLVYSVTQRLSFTRIKQYYNEILRIKDGESFGAVLVGNKLDQAGERQVSTQEGEQLAQQWGVPFFETSAKMNINAEVAFLTLARITRDQRICAETPSGAAISSENLVTPAAVGAAPQEPNTLSSAPQSGYQPQYEAQSQAAQQSGPQVAAAATPQAPQGTPQGATQGTPQGTPQGSSQGASQGAPQSLQQNATQSQSRANSGAPQHQSRSSKETSKKKSKKGKCLVM